MSVTLTYRISFGDCDPAGIAFYPNSFRWMDSAFHLMLHPLGGHAALCKKLGAVGLGLVNASAQFRHPMRDGDLLELQATIAEWSRRSLTLVYEGQVGKTRTFTGSETRCLFTQTETGIVASDLAQLRALLEP
tara:strand:- start:677 stop:1075 length:399 start_codon:yes stop_codon:yes gene_type:complete